MPRIPDIAIAEAALDSEEEKLSATFGQIHALQNEMYKLQEKVDRKQKRIDRALKDFRMDLDEAHDRQRLSLTRWIPRVDGRSYSRYRLRTTGPSDKCWDCIAWLRRMKVRDAIPGKWPLGSAAWWPWTLNISYVWNTEGIESPGHQIFKHLPEKKSDIHIGNLHGEEALLSFADAVLEKAGFHLTDLDNDPPAEGDA